MPNITPENLQIYRSLFYTRDDVFARYWVDMMNKKTGYVPKLMKPWIAGREIDEVLKNFKNSQVTEDLHTWSNCYYILNLC